MSFYLILSRSTAMAILKVMDDLEAVKKDDSVTPSEQLVKKSQSLQRLVKGSKIPTPLQLLVKEMPGQTLPHFFFRYRDAQSNMNFEGCLMACSKVYQKSRAITVRKKMAVSMIR